MKQDLRIQEMVYDMHTEGKATGTPVAALTVTMIGKEVKVSVIGTTPDIASSIAGALGNYPEMRDILIAALLMDASTCDCANCKAKREKQGGGGN